MSNRALGRVVVISGPSGVGKTTVCEALTQHDDTERVVTTTTRCPRAGEVSGEDYLFSTLEEFEKGVQSEAFLEHAEVHGHRYGTPRRGVLDILARGKTALLAIDVQGAEQLRQTFANPATHIEGSELITVFLLPPNEEVLKQRLSGRGTEDQEALRQRLATAKTEMQEQAKYDHVVVNDDLDETVRRIRDCFVQPAR